MEQAIKKLEKLIQIEKIRTFDSMTFVKQTTRYYELTSRLNNLQKCES
jgi:hypothetical protein